MRGFLPDVKRSLWEIWEIRKIPQIYCVILFIILRGLTCPKFTDFWYYYNTQIKHFS